MKTEEQQILTATVRSCYDEQDVRIRVGNRIAMNYLNRIGQKPGEKLTDPDMLAEKGEIQGKNRRLTDGIVSAVIKPKGMISDSLDADQKNKVKDKVLKLIKETFSEMTQGRKLLPQPDGFKRNEIISSYSELILISHYVDLLRDEEKHMRQLEKMIEGVPIWEKFMKGVKGCGPTLAAVIISEVDIYKANYPSSLWKLFGYDVARDGRGRSRREEHLVKRKYIAKDGKEKERDSVTYNPFLKTKGRLLAECMMKVQGPYRDIYLDNKHCLENKSTEVDEVIPGVRPIQWRRVKWSEATPTHRHQAALRYTVKMFLADLYNAWRPLEGLPVAPPYHEAKLGHKHRKAA